ncbi:MAG: PAS domain-containing protein [Actinobacteria bacterium]|nr:PAS domain-containing protein [Actinomycetota bacterium]
MNDLLPVIGVLALVALLAVVVFRKPAGHPVSSPIEPLPTASPARREPFEGTEEILQKMNEGVLLVDAGMRPTFANRAARTLLGLDDVLLPARLPLPELVTIAKEASAGAGPGEGEVAAFYPQRATFRVQAAPLESGAVMITLLDVTDEHKSQRIRREFVAHASHELKSPVASLQTLAEAVVEALPDDAVAAERFAGRLMGETDRLAKLITDLLDLSRLEDPTRPPEAACDLAAVARRETSHAEAAAHGSGIGLASDVDGPLMIKGDPQQLSLLIRNLIENAIRYTPSGGSVGITARRDGDSVLLEVTDDGPGIPQEARGRIFERFYRLDKGRSRDRGGTGLGLAIVKHVAELHRGTIEVGGELGEGSVFTVTLPALGAPAPETSRAVSGPGSSTVLPIDQHKETV